MTVTEVTDTRDESIAARAMRVVSWLGDWDACKRRGRPHDWAFKRRDYEGDLDPFDDSFYYYYDRVCFACGRAEGIAQRWGERRYWRVRCAPETVLWDEPDIIEHVQGWVDSDWGEGHELRYPYQSN